MLYVGSAHDSHLDQVLDEILVGPVPVGLNKFVLQADAPDPARLPPDELVGVTVVLVTCSYQEREFVRVGYYVNNEYTEPTYLAAVAAANAANTANAAAAAAATDPAGPIAEGGEGENDNTSNNDNGEEGEGEQTQQKAPAVSVPAVPAYPHIEMRYVQRQILADKPRVTKFPIPWGKPELQGQVQQQQAVGDAGAATTATKGFAADNSDDNEMAGTPSTAATSSAAGSPMQMG